MDELELGGRYKASVLLDFLSQNHKQVSLVSPIDVDLWSPIPALTMNNEFIVENIQSCFVHTINEKNLYSKQRFKIYYITSA